MRTAQQFGIDSARQIEIIRKNRFARALGHRVDFAQRLADDGEIFLLHVFFVYFAVSFMSCREKADPSLCSG
jgi:hypothetical protein